MAARYTRAERVAQARALLAEGMSRTRIAVELDLSPHYVTGLLADPDDVGRRRRAGRLEVPGEPRCVSLADVPLEQRMQAAWEMCREAQTEAERWQWFGLGLIGPHVQQRVLA